MEIKKADRLSIIIGAVGVMFLMMPLFDAFPGRESALLLAGLIFIIAAFVFKELGNKE